MRKFVAALSGLAAVIVGAATVPLGWVATHVASEDGYVSFTSDFASDPQLQDALADDIGDEIVSSSGLPAGAAEAIKPIISDTAAQVSDRPGFRQAWEQTQRSSHRLMFADQRDLDPEQDATDRIAVDLAPLARYVLGEIGADSLPATVDPPEQIIVPVSGTSERRVIDRIAQTPQQAVTGLVVTVVLAGFALLISRRRSSAVAWLGIGAIAAVAALWTVSDAAVDQLLARAADPSVIGGRVQQLLAVRAVDSLQGWLVWVLVGGGIAVVAGGLARLVSGRRTPADV